jgi:YesN/AraC family two-component response regulator
MVTDSCVIKVKDTLVNTGFPDLEVKLGEINSNENLSEADLDQIRSALLSSGFELVKEKKDILVHQIRTLILQIIYYSDEPLSENLSVYLSNKLNYDYGYLSNLFSNVLGITIEQFVIYNRIERVKELLDHTELTLTDIAYKMHYSSVAHLSGQFKKIVGMTPSEFKQSKGRKQDSPNRL